MGWEDGWTRWKAQLQCADSRGRPRVIWESAARRSGSALLGGAHGTLLYPAQAQPLNLMYRILVAYGIAYGTRRNVPPKVHTTSATCVSLKAPYDLPTTPPGWARDDGCEACHRSAHIVNVRREVPHTPGLLQGDAGGVRRGRAEWQASGTVAVGSCGTF